MANSTNANKSNKKVEELLTVATLKPFFIEQGIVPKYTDSSHYVGCGTRANVFSVNPLKKQYNIYCSNDVFKAIGGVKGVTYTKDGNATDKTRNNLVVATTTEQLKSLLALVKQSVAGVAI